MSVLIVVPAWQAEPYLAATLASVLSQSYPDWVCVVIDDGSTDRTAEIAQQFASKDARIRVVSRPNTGVSRARMDGLGSTPSSWVLFLDADDLLLPDALEGLLHAASRRSDSVGACAWSEIIDENGVVKPGEHSAVQRTRLRVRRWHRLELLHPDADTDFETLSIWGHQWPPCTVLIRRRALRLAGERLADNVGTQEDWDLFWRLARFGPFVYLDQQVALYRRHNASRSQSDVHLGHWRAQVRANVFEVVSREGTRTQAASMASGLRRLHLWALRGSARRVLHAVMEAPAELPDAARAVVYHAVRLVARTPPTYRHYDERRERRLRELDAAVDLAISVVARRGAPNRTVPLKRAASRARAR